MPFVKWVRANSVMPSRSTRRLALWTQTREKGSADYSLGFQSRERPPTRAELNRHVASRVSDLGVQ